MERVISIKGSIENMSRAEAMISAKLRQSYESDLQALTLPFSSISYSLIIYNSGACVSNIYA